VASEVRVEWLAVETEQVWYLDGNKSFSRFKGLLDAVAVLAGTMRSQSGLPTFPPWHKQPRNSLFWL
jgi:hypothetical protein